MLTDYRPVMLVDNIFHSRGCLQTFMSTEKKITSYEWEHPCSNTEKGDGVIRFCNSASSSPLGGPALTWKSLQWTALKLKQNTYRSIGLGCLLKKGNAFSALYLRQQLTYCVDIKKAMIRDIQDKLIKNSPLVILRKYLKKEVQSHSGHVQLVKVKELTSLFLLSY
jgi:hypothetical protein